MFAINSTLFIQIINFIGAYILIRYLLFSPAVTILHKEEALDASLIATIEEHLALIALKKDELAKQWRACQEYCLAHVPHIIRKKQRAPHERSMPTSIPLTNSLIAQYVSLFVQHIEQRIDHVH